jgi:hypothetical protein
MEASIISWTFEAFTLFPHLRRPYPTTKNGWRKWAENLEKHAPLIDPLNLSLIVTILIEDIAKVREESETYWPLFWEGDKSITLNQVIGVLGQLGMFYIRMGEEHHKWFASLPKTRRWNQKAAEKFFAEYISSRMKRTYGQPLDSVVAALTEVAFDLREGVSPDTVRGRRRGSTTPENSKRKSY